MIVLLYNLVTVLTTHLINCLKHQLKRIAQQTRGVEPVLFYMF